MIPIEPTELPDGSRRVVFAKDQPAYFPLPAVVDPMGVVLTEWEPSVEELHRLMTGGRVRIYLHTFGEPLQPLSVHVTLPDSGATES